MIEIIKYDQEEHFETVKSWGNDRGLTLIPSLLSDYGYILKENNEYKLAIWVYFFQDVPIVQLDHLCTNPSNNPFKGIIYLRRMLEFIKMFLKEIEKLNNKKFLMIRVYVKKEMKLGCEKLNFVIDERDGITCNLLLTE